MKAFKRTVSVLLSLMLVLGMMTIGISASAAEATVTATSNLGDNSTINFDSTTQTVTVNYRLQSSLLIANIQGVVTFDPAVLSFKSYSAPKLATGSIIANTNKVAQGRFIINSTNADCFDYSTEDVVVSVVFDVVSVANTTVNMEYQVITGNTASDHFTADTDVSIVDYEYVNPDTTLYSTEVTEEIYPPAPVYDLTIRDFLQSVSLNLQGKIGVTFTFKIPASVADKTITVVTSAGDLPEQEDVITASNLNTTYFIYARMMTDDITVRVYVDGTYIDSYAYSVVKYVNSNTVKNGTAKLKNLVYTMANYGAEVQNFFNYKTDNLPNAQTGYALTPVAASDIPDRRAYTMSEMTAMGIQLTNASLDLQSDTAINFAFKDTTGITATANGEPIETSAANTYTIGNIRSSQLDEQQTLVITKNGASTTLKWTVLDLCRTYINQNGAMKNTAMALYRYNEAANAYFD